MYAISLDSKLFSDVAEFSGEKEANGFDLGTCDFVEPGTAGYRTVVFATREAAEENVAELGPDGGLNDLMGQAFDGLVVVEL